MKVAYNWIKEFINIDWEAEKTGKLLTDLGLEVEGIETVETIKAKIAIETEITKLGRLSSMILYI